MVKINFQPRIAHPLHDFAEVAVETIYADAFVIKRWQHQHTRASMLYRLRGELDRLSDRATACARHDARQIDAGRDQRVEQQRALFDRQRVRLAIGPEYGQPAFLRQQPVTMPDESLPIRRKITLKWRNDGRQHTPNPL